MNSGGDYTFRRVAIRRKSGAYRPPGVPRPWSRPLPLSGRADSAAVPGQAA
ncbi:FYVE, and PH domain-containing 4 isoform X1, partial [Sigmodon hispidus]